MGIALAQSLYSSRTHLGTTFSYDRWFMNHTATISAVSTRPAASGLQIGWQNQYLTYRVPVGFRCPGLRVR
jgi:hypothetical protein